jgi:hypothetical protein
LDICVVATFLNPPVSLPSVSFFSFTVYLSVPFIVNLCRISFCNRVKQMFEITAILFVTQISFYHFCCPNWHDILNL